MAWKEYSPEVTKNNYLETHYFECECFNDEHTLKFIYCPEDNELYINIFLVTHESFFKRLWVGIKYIFGYKCRFGHWDSWLMRHGDVERLKDLTKRYEENLAKLKGKS